jgi:4-amino-4-deoxy-L-arabinose transferase-like glycosyltransferase
VTELSGNPHAPPGPPHEGGEERGAESEEQAATPGRERGRRRRWTLPGALFFLSLGVYLATRLVGIERFPIYFFTDEAIQTMHAADLVRDGWRGWDHVLLPTYFRNGEYYNLGVSVYAQVPAYLLFGKSVLATRATSALITLLAAVALALILRDIFRIPYWWLGTMLLAIAPAWFLHSRTAFETAEFVSFYAAALYAYLLYRYRSPRYLYPTLLLSALAFYTYSAGQVVLAVTGTLLLASDAAYHWRNRKTVLIGFGLAALLALPYLRFRLSHAYSPSQHLATLYSYWMQPISVSQKLARLRTAYLRGLGPAYWFGHAPVDLVRHVMKGYGNLLLWTAAPCAVGLLLALRNIRSSAYRAVLIAALAAPAGGALVDATIPRVLVFVVPATLLTALGLSLVLQLADRLSHRRSARVAENPRERPVSSVAVFGLLAALNFGMLHDAIVNGPLWFRDYGLGGMQWGARQLFGRLREELAKNPGAKFMVSPSWTNGTDVVARFFLSDPLPVAMGAVDGFMKEKLPLNADMTFVMLPAEYDRATRSGKFSSIRVEDVIRYPDGRPGFYFVKLAYADNFEQILAVESARRRQLLETTVTIDGEPVQVRHSKIDLGSVQGMFDDDPATVARTEEANPFVVEWEFAAPRTLREMEIGIGSIEARITIRLAEAPDAEPVSYSETLRGTVERPAVVLRFPGPTPARFVRIEVLEPGRPEPDHVHIFGIRLR